MRIAVDIDEVLCKTNDYFLEYFNAEHGTNFTRENIVNYEYDSFTGFEKEYVYTKLVDYVHKNLDKFRVMPYAKDILSDLKKEHELFILSSRDISLKDRTHAWLEFHFVVNFFDDVILIGGHYEQKLCKSDVCVEKGFHMLIEDAPKFAKNTSDLGISVLLMDCPWNRNLEETRNLIRVFNWNDIYLQLQFKK